MFLTVVIFIITLLILVVSHELGHFAAAKKFGVKVLEFGFGLPPKLWGKKIGETLVSVNLLPIGGFVKLLGEDEVDPKLLENKRSFAYQPVWQRIAIVAAGVLMNLALAVVLFWVVLSSQGFKEKIPLLIPYNFVGVQQVNESTVVVGAVAANSPAEIAGIKAGDRIVAVNGKKLESSQSLIEETKQRAGEVLSLTLLDPEDKTRQVEVTPRKDPPSGQGPLGVGLGTIDIAYLSYATPWQKATAGVVHSYNLASYSFTILGEVIGSAFKMRDLEPVSESFSGPVGITKIAGTILTTKSPLIPYLNFMALLSLNLAIINILPFPALDGGRIFFLIIEAVFRRKVKAEVERFVHTIGMALLLALIVLVTFSDIKKFF